MKHVNNKTGNDCSVAYRSKSYDQVQHPFQQLRNKQKLYNQSAFIKLTTKKKKNCGIAETHTTFQMINPNKYVKTIPGYNWAHSDGGQSGAMPQCK